MGFSIIWFWVSFSLHLSLKQRQFIIRIEKMRWVKGEKGRERRRGEREKERKKEERERGEKKGDRE